MKKRFVLSFEDFVKSEYYNEFKNSSKHILSFEEFVKAQKTGQPIEIIAMTYDLSKAKSRDYRQLWRLLNGLGFQKSINGRPMPKNTFILPVTNHTLPGITNAIVNYINTTGKHFKVFACLTNTYELRP